MKIPKVNLKLYWSNLNAVAQGDWTLAFGTALCIGIVLAVGMAMILLFVLLGLLISYPVVFAPLLVIFVIYRLGYAAVKGK